MYRDLGYKSFFNSFIWHFELVFMTAPLAPNMALNLEVFTV